MTVSNRSKASRIYIFHLLVSRVGMMREEETYYSLKKLDVLEHTLLDYDRVVCIDWVHNELTRCNKIAAIYESGKYIAVWNLNISPPRVESVYPVRAIANLKLCWNSDGTKLALCGRRRSQQQKRGLICVRYYLQEVDEWNQVEFSLLSVVVYLVSYPFNLRVHQIERHRSGYQRHRDGPTVSPRWSPSRSRFR